MGPREHRWELVALVASVLAHLAFVTWATRQTVPTATHEVTAEFIFVEPTPPPTATPPPEEPAPPEPKPAEVKVRPPPPPRIVEKAAPIEPASQGPRTDVPTEPPPPVEDVPKMRVSLLPGSSFAVSLDAGFIADDLPDPNGLRALEPPKDLVGTLAKETIGMGRVDRGLVHPYYSQLGKALLKNWDADRVAKSGLKGLVQQTGENMKLYNQIWADRASEYGKSGNPMGDVNLGTNRRAAGNDRILGLTGSDGEQRKELQKQLKEAYKATRRAVIRVVQDQSGKLTRVELVQPSTDQQVDKEALADVRSAAEKLPPPPPEALEGRTSVSSLWSFELIVSISPPVPTFTFEFDEALGFIDMRLPLDRRIYKKVRLVSVE